MPLNLLRFHKEIHLSKALVYYCESQTEIFADKQIGFSVVGWNVVNFREFCGGDRYKRLK